MEGINMSNTVTSVVARGYVVADFDTATFSLSFHEVAPKSRDAKSKLKKGVDQITSTLEGLKRKGLVMLGSTFRTSVTVAPNHVYDRHTGQNKIEGQKATYTVTFQTPKLEMVSEAYDVLSEIDANEMTVNSPVFSVRAESALKQQALEDAWKVAQILFGNQCRTLGLDASNYSVSSWQVNYSGRDHGGFSKGSNFSNNTEAMLGDGDDAIELNSGRAVVDVILTANYIKTGS
jgi:uncharacterized protein YggE